jgi:peptidoglycan/xylan/chitin deacetylase (PgdA/CDA1 family)
MINAFTVDLEPWVCYYTNSPLFKSQDGGNLLMTTQYLLDILEENDVTATFFTIGKIFEWFPKLLKDIQSRGHEIAFHSYSHRKLDGNLLDSEIARSKEFIERFQIVGFRAPRLEITLKNINSLASARFLYDSSTYGSSNNPRRINGVLEIPVSTYPIRNNNTFPKAFKGALRMFEFPVGSGLFMGLLHQKILAH